MGKLTFEITMSVDGFVAGPNATLESPLGEGGERLHEWAYGLATWRETHGQEGGVRTRDDEIVEEQVDRTGAVIMGREMFGGEGAWADEPWDGWWGDDPPFHVPVFVVTHHGREPLVKRGGTTFTFVTGGIEAALEQARAAAGDKDVNVTGGANVAQQYLQAGLLDEIHLHIAPLLLGDGVRLFENHGPLPVQLEITRVVESPAVTHLRYRVVK